MKKQYIMAGITVFLWSTLSAVSKLLVNDLSPMTVLFYTSVIASLTLWIINLIRSGTKRYQHYRKKDYLIITGLGFLGLFCYTALYYIGLATLTSQIACIINYMWPMLIVLFSCILLKESFTKKKLLAILISFSGMLLITLQGYQTVSEGNVSGMGACFLAAICYALYSVLNKKYNYDQWLVLHIAFTVSAVFSGIYCLGTNTLSLPSFLPFVGMLWIGIFVNAIAYVLWGIALNTGNTANISILAYLCPFLSLVFGRILLNERITFFSLLGLILIIGGVLLQLKKPKEELS